MSFDCFLLQEGIFDHVGEEVGWDILEKEQKEKEETMPKKLPTSSMHAINLQKKRSRFLFSFS